MWSACRPTVSSSSTTRSSNCWREDGQPVDGQRLADDRADRHARVERGERVLEDDLHVAAERVQLLAAECDDVPALEPDLARGRLDQPQDAAAGGRLAAAGFADQAQRLAGGDVEAHAVDGVHAVELAREQAAADREVLDQILDAQQRLGHCAHRLRRARRRPCGPARSRAAAARLRRQIVGGEAAARGEAAAGRQARAGSAPRRRSPPGASCGWRRGRCAGSSGSGPACRGGAAWRTAARRAPPRPPCRHT